jgi:hypothetical protein
MGRVVVVVATLVVVVAVLVVWLAFRNPAMRYLNKIEVVGYAELSSTGDVSPVGPWAESLFVGPAADDVFAIVTAPGLRLRLPRNAYVSAQKPAGEPGSDPHWLAYGDAPDNCHVSVRDVTDDSKGEDGLSGAQITEMKAGSVQVLSIKVTCGDGQLFGAGTLSSE